jgi:hypothetical protein
MGYWVLGIRNMIPESCMKINEKLKASDLSASGGLVQNPGDIC